MELVPRMANAPCVLIRGYYPSSLRDFELALARGRHPIGSFRRGALGDLDEILGAEPAVEGGADVGGLHLKIEMRGVDGLIEREMEFGAREPAASDFIEVGFGHGDLAQHEDFGLVQFGVGHVIGAHFVQVTDDDTAGFGNVGRVAGVFHLINATGEADLELGGDEVNQSRVFAQVAIEARGVKGAAENVVAEFEGVVIVVGAGQGERVRERDFVLHATGVRHVQGRRRVVGGGRIQRVGLCAGGFPGSEIFHGHCGGMFGRDFADNDDGCQVRTDCVLIVLRYIPNRERLNTFRCGLALDRVRFGEHRCFERALGVIAGALYLAGDTSGNFRLEEFESSFRQGRGQLVVREQFHAAVEIGGQDLQGEISAGGCGGANIVQGFFEREAVQSFCAEGEQMIQRLVHAVFAFGHLDFGPVLDAAIDRHRIADGFRLNNQLEAVGEIGNDGVDGEFGNFQAIQALLGPIGKFCAFSFAAGEGFGAAKALCGDGFAGWLRR